MAQSKHNRRRQASKKLREVRLNIRFRDYEFQSLRQAAEQQHISISSFARAAALNAADEIMRHSFDANGVVA